MKESWVWWCTLVMLTFWRLGVKDMDHREQEGERGRGGGGGRREF